MDRVTVYLRTSLFSFGGPEAHVPPGVMVVVGQIVDRPASSLVLEATQLFDERGRQLSEERVTLQLPWSKIDHILVHKD